MHTYVTINYFMMMMMMHQLSFSGAHVDVHSWFISDRVNIDITLRPVGVGELTFAFFFYCCLLLKSLDQARCFFFIIGMVQRHYVMATKLFASIATPKECAALFPVSVEAVAAVAGRAIDRATAALDSVYTAPRKFHATCKTTDLAATELSISSSILSVVKNVHPLKAVRDEASKKMVELDAFSIDHFSSNRKLYLAIKAVKEQDPPSADAQLAYWLDEELRSFQRRGMDLPEELFALVVALQKELSELSTTFSTNVAEDKTQVVVDVADLAGVPESIVANLASTGDSNEKRILKMDYPTYFGVMKNCEVASTRRAMADAFENRAYPANASVLREVIFKRQKLAKLLGFASYSHYDLDSKMAKTPEAAKAFIDSLVPGLQQKWQQELTVLKRNLHPSVILTDDGKLQSYDIAFCINQVKKTELNVSEVTIQEYFPMSSTVKALFSIYEAFFDIRFEQFENGDDLWSKDVATLAVHNRCTDELLGHIILDLFPREGKYTHACCHSVVPAYMRDDNTFSPALSVVLANFPTASGEKPPLFGHDDVETFFHEFGHAIHGLMGRTKMGTAAGTRVKRDFVELPSQMLEEWLWEPAILKKVTSHYKTQQPLPADLIQAKVASQNAFSGRDSLRQLVFASYALAIFGAPFSTRDVASAEELDTTALFHDIQERILPGIAFSQTSRFECAFAHLMGYAATYYGYMWSEVFAQDVFDYIKARDGLLSPVLGRRYVDMIIGVGGSRDPNAMLRDFLEREPNADAFLKKLGIHKA